MYRKLKNSIKYLGLGKTIIKCISFLRNKILTTQYIVVDNNLHQVQAMYDKSDEYQYYVEHEKLVDPLVKIIAFYLPQFHPFPENDLFWGKGFTEWTNTTKARQNFVNHYQPHLPIHLGFYDLRIVDNLREQADLARNYGVFGFSFYYYWFSGKKVMNTPIELLYSNKDIDIKYCICWANENWTRTWDGQSTNILLEQRYLPDDPKNFLHDVIKYFKDGRYIKIDNKPVLIVYNAQEIKDFDRYITIWRSEIINFGFEGIYIICTNAFGYRKMHDIDSVVEFPPHGVVLNHYMNEQISFLNESFRGYIYNYDAYAEVARETKSEDKLMQSLMLGWDNTARRQNNSTTFHNFTIKKFKLFLKQRLFSCLSNKKLNENEKFVFINAWNEWAEGTHLEPDRRNGFGYLEAVYLNIKAFDKKFLKYLNPSFTKKSNIAIIFHLFYLNTLDVFYQKSLKFQGAVDFYFTVADDVVSIDLVKRIEELFPGAQILICENRGRDILPFLELLKLVNQLEYEFICKTHSKQTLLPDGGNWLSALLDPLFTLNLTQIQSYINNRVGYLIPHGFQLKIDGTWNGHTCLVDNEKNLGLLTKLLNIVFNKESLFAAGSMFWFNPKAFSGIEKIENWQFTYENGASDGEMIHAIERIFGLLSEHNNYQIEIIRK
ncbi:MAG: glycoside hydrolase family 99-like domain-containing protein [Neisseriaceae bacterium]